MTMYQSSKGPVEIDTMPLRYAKNALDKLVREAPTRTAEIAALKEHVDKGGAEPSDNPRVAMGGNNPPEPTSIDDAKELLANIEVEASAWFDGADIVNDAQADEVSRLIDAARKASKQFDGVRKMEKQPHVDAGKTVDETWRPLIAGADRVTEVAKGALTPWLMAKEKEKRDAEDVARREAAEAAAVARKAAEENDGSLAAAKARDAAIETASATAVELAKAENAKAGAKGAGMARTVSLRTTWRATVEDHRALLNHVAKMRPDDLSTFLDNWAASAVRAGSRELPGVNIWEEKVAA